MSTLLVLAVVIGLPALFFFRGCDASIPVTGRVYVVTKGKDVIKMPSVNVWAFEEKRLSKCVAGLNALLATNFEKFSREEATKEMSKAELLDAWRGVDSGSTIVRHIKTIGYADHTTTDIDGAFAFTLKKAGRYCFVATAERQVGGGVERYFWLRYPEDGLSRFGNYTMPPMDNSVDQYSDSELPENYYWLKLLRESFGLKDSF